MFKRYVVAAVACLVVSNDCVLAQDSEEVAAWLALVSTPAGAFAPAPRAGASGGSAFFVAYGRMKVEGEDDVTSNFAAGVRLGRLRIQGGLRQVSDCSDCGGYMAGVDLELPLASLPIGATTELDIALNPAVGYGKPKTTDFAGIEIEANQISAAVTVPFVLRTHLGSGMVVAPYVAPGFGFGLISAEALGEKESESGTRTMIGFGAVLTSASGTFQLAAGMQKVMLDEAPSVLGVSLSIGR